ncbi:MAG TPA: NYN domain-containing protein [Solirubrobacteraceae bacterium]|nr:NYN domain-containing protein [Solirubrobacteraceae bacterium]
MTGARSAWLIDGNNVMGSRPDGWWRDRRGAARRLAAQLADFAAREGVPVTVVFDGAPFDLEVPDDAPLEVAFAARRGRDAADDEIARLVAEAADPATLRVVTSDAGLAQRVREHGAEVVPAGRFRRGL